MRIIVNNVFAKFLTREYVGRLCRLMLVNYGWHCVYNELCVVVDNLNK